MRLALVVFALTAASCGRIGYDRSSRSQDAADASASFDARAVSETGMGREDAFLTDIRDFDSPMHDTSDLDADLEDVGETDGSEAGAREDDVVDVDANSDSEGGGAADAVEFDAGLVVDADTDVAVFDDDAAQDATTVGVDVAPDVPPDIDPCAGVSISVNAISYPMMEVDRAFSAEFEASPSLMSGRRYTYSSPNLPFGALNPSTALWNGTPTGVLSSSVRIVATDPEGCQGYRDFSVEIACSPTLAAVPTTLPNARVGMFYNAGFSIVPNPNGARYSVIGRVGPPPLPPGLTGTGDPLFITGNPTMSGTYAFQLVIIGTNGCRVFPSYTIVVDP